MVDWPVWGEAVERLTGHASVMVHGDEARALLRAVWACPTCKGDGKRSNTTVSQDEATGLIDQTGPCPSCGGSGLQTEWECGEGWDKACRRWHTQGKPMAPRWHSNDHSECGPVVKIRLEQT